VSHPKWINDVERKLAAANLFTRQPRWSLLLKGTVHGSLWLIQPRWSTWGTRVNAP
jgi:hypothetical protein